METKHKNVHQMAPLSIENDSSLRSLIVVPYQVDNILDIWFYQSAPF